MAQPHNMAATGAPVDAVALKLPDYKGWDEYFGRHAASAPDTAVLAAEGLGSSAAGGAGDGHRKPAEGPSGARGLPSVDDAPPPGISDGSKPCETLAVAEGGQGAPDGAGSHDGHVGVEAAAAAPRHTAGTKDPGMAAATARLSRSLTMVAALRALAAARALPAATRGPLVLHVAGADFTEGRSVAACVACFRPLLEHLAAAAAALGPAGDGGLKVVLQLSGPGVAVPAGAHDAGVVDGVNVQVMATTQLCHEALAPESPLRWPAPHAVFAFDAGVWGYAEWVPSIRFLRDLAVPVVVTAYNAIEADDDEDAIAAAGVAPTAWVWTPRANPFASGKTSLGPPITPPSSEDEVEGGGACSVGDGGRRVRRVLADNSCWQCFCGAVAPPG